MATSSSDGRPSVDSEPPTSSSHSHTLGGPGSSVDSGSPLSRHSIQEQDFARRKERVRRSGGFLLDDSLSATSRNNNGLRIGKTRRSAQASQSTMQDRGPSPGPVLQQPAIDPNQLVHMALNLSESRRRNLSAGQLLAPQPQQQHPEVRSHSTSSESAYFLVQPRYATEPATRLST